MVEAVADRALDDAGGFRGHQAALVLALEFRLANEDGDQRRARDHDVVRRQYGGAFGLADAFGMVLQSAQDRCAQSSLVGASVRGRDGVAIGMDEAVVLGEPRHRPFERAVAAGLLHLPGKHLVGDERLAADLLGQIVLEAAGEVEHRLARRTALVVQGEVVPADLDTTEQVGLGARHPEQPRGLEGGFGPEDLLVRPEAHLGAAPVEHLADLFEPARRQPARKGLAVEHLAPGDLDFEPLGQRIDDRHADAVQAARGLVGAGIELSTGVEHRHDDLDGRFVGKFRMRLDRHAAAVVGNGDETLGIERDVDEGGMAGDGLVHRIVDHLGEEVVQGALVGATDVHARAPPHRLQPFKDLDRCGVVLRLDGMGVASAVARRALGWYRCLCRRQLACRIAEEIAGIRHVLPSYSDRIPSSVP